jgi:hypothetical protein
VPSSLPLAGRASAKRRVGVEKSKLSTQMKSSQAATAPLYLTLSPGRTTPHPSPQGGGEDAAQPSRSRRSAPQTKLGVKLPQLCSLFVLDIAHKLGYGCEGLLHEGRARGVGRGSGCGSRSGRLRTPAAARIPSGRPGARHRIGPGSSSSSQPRRRRIRSPREIARGCATSALSQGVVGMGQTRSSPCGGARGRGSGQEPCAGGLWPPARGGSPARVLRAPPGSRSHAVPRFPQLFR